MQKKNELVYRRSHKCIFPAQVLTTTLFETQQAQAQALQCLIMKGLKSTCSCFCDDFHLHGDQNLRKHLCWLIQRLQKYTHPLEFSFTVTTSWNLAWLFGVQVYQLSPFEGDKNIILLVEGDHWILSSSHFKFSEN